MAKGFQNFVKVVKIPQIWSHWFALSFCVQVWSEAMNGNLLGQLGILGYLVSHGAL